MTTRCKQGGASPGNVCSCGTKMSVRLTKPPHIVTHCFGQKSSKACGPIKRLGN